MEALAESVYGAVRGYVAKHITALSERLEKRIGEIPAGDRGEPGPEGPQGAPGLGTKGLDGRDGRDGIDGAPGRDAIDLEFRDGVDATRSYARGTLATFDGGVIRATRTTDPLADTEGDIVKAGWHVLWVGVKAIFAERSEDGRQITLHAEYTGSRKHELAVWEMPVMLYRGVFSPKAGEYRTGDVVTWDGHLWHCEEPTNGAPGQENKSWKLIVRRGERGRDANSSTPPTGPVRLT